jgi:hypothetical protein
MFDPFLSAHINQKFKVSFDFGLWVNHFTYKTILGDFFTKKTFLRRQKTNLLPAGLPDGILSDQKYQF